MRKSILIKIVLIGSISLISSLSVFADSDEQTIAKNKTATYDYTTEQGTITLVNYLPGNTTIISEAKPLDAVLVLDFSSSMSDQGTTSNTYTKVVGNNKQSIVDLCSSFNHYSGAGNGNQKADGDYANTAGWTIDGETVYFRHINLDNGDKSLNWAYYTKNGIRYYVLPDGQILRANSTASPQKSSNWPTYSDGYGHTLTITPVYSVFALMKFTYGTDSVTGDDAKTRMSALRKGVYDFIDQVHNHAVKTGLHDRISIVTFQNNGSSKYPTLPGLDTWNDYAVSGKRSYLAEIYHDYVQSSSSPYPFNSAKDDLGYKRSLVLKRFVDVSDANAVNILKHCISEISYLGVTPHDVGVKLGYELMNSYGRPSTGTDAAERVVIVFSDGKPVEAGGSTAYSTIGTQAVVNSKSIKDIGAKVYSIFCPGKDTSGSDLSTTEGFMQRVSSNYRYATTYNGGNNGQPLDTGYYYLAGEDLSAIFKKITQKIIVDINEKYGVNTLVADFVNNNYFKLPEGATADDIHCYTNACVSAPQYPPTGPADTVYTWSPSQTEIDTLDVRIVKSSDASKPDSIFVSGFNFSENWCGWNGTQIHGNRLLVTIPFTLKNKVSFGDLETNTSDSGVYIQPKDSTGYKKDTPYPIPKIPFCKLIVKRIGLQKGESAIYNIKDDKGQIIDKISLNGVGENTAVVDTLYGLPGVKFTVEETKWNWAYSSGGSKTKESSDGTYVLQYDFSGDHIDTKDEKNPANLHNHDEAYTINRFWTLPDAVE